MHLEVSPSMTVLAAHEVAHDVKDAVRNALPSIADVLVHIEPDSSPPGTEH
jgi:divalent metal cation (Fe/Co/Zn/Cd) transporter